MSWQAKLEVEARNLTRGNSSGHDYWHHWRVMHLCEVIGKAEHLDLNVLKACALTHDVYANDYPHHIDLALYDAPTVLKNVGFPEHKIPAVIHCIANHENYAPGKVRLSREALAFQDADRLDAIGAIGIARTFTFGGSIGVPLWIPKHMSRGRDVPWDYHGLSKSTINHFYDKLLRLKNNMNTKTGRRLAVRRHRFMRLFLREFFSEWPIKPPAHS